MKNKMIIIILAALAVVAVVYFMYFKKFDKTEENNGSNSVGVGNPNATDKTEEQKAAQEVLQEELNKTIASESTSDAIGTETAVLKSGTTSYLDGLTAGEISDYKAWIEYIKLKTGKDYTGYEFSIVEGIYNDTLEMVELKKKLESDFGVVVSLSDKDTNELDELKNIYNKNEQLLIDAAKNYANKFVEQYKVDQMFNTKKATSLGGSYTKLTSYQGWNPTIMEGLLSLPKEYAVIANNEVKKLWNGSYSIEPKKKKFDTALADAKSVNMNGKSITQALKVSNWMLQEKDKKSNPAGIGAKVYEVYTGYGL